MKNCIKSNIRLLAKILTVIIIISCFTAACQPAPEKQVIVNKRDQDFSQTNSNEDAKVNPYPETAKDNWMSKDGTTTITIDAKVITPDAEKYPVVLAEPGEVSMDFVKKAVEVLFDGKPVYEPRTGLSKEEITAEILELKQALADPKNSKSDGLNADDPQIVKETEKLFQDRIKILENMYKDAPDKLIRKEAEYVFKPKVYYEDPTLVAENIKEYKDSDDIQAQQILEEYDNVQKIVLDTDLDEGFYGQISAVNFDSDWSNQHYFYFIKSKTLMGNGSPGMDYSEDRPEVKISRQEAMTLAEDTINKLGFTNLVLIDRTQRIPYLNSENEKIRSYNFTFVPGYQGVPLVGSEALPNEIFRPYYEVECIGIAIDDSGVVSLEWQNPLKTTNVINDNTGLLDFEQIMERAKTQIELEYNAAKLSWYAPENSDYEEYIASIKSASLTIDEISLVMLKIPVKDNLQGYYIIPAWIFKGSDSLEFKDMDHAGFSGWHEYKTYTAINAVDGSTISVSPVNGII